MKSLQQICSLMAVSGFEKYSTDEFINLFTQYGLSDVKCDCHGNIYGRKFVSDEAPEILIDAHIDEIGLIVKEIKENGFLLFDSVGGIDKSNLYCREVTVYGTKEIYGVIGAVPPHLKKDDEETLIIDTGIKNISEFVKVGDPIKIKSDFLKLKNNQLTSGVLDNRAGLICALNCAKKIKANANITVLGSIREETGTQGIELFVKSHTFDLAIVIDVTHGYFKGLSDYKAYPLNDGFTICYGGILDNEITRKIENHLMKNEIKYNTEFEPSHPGTNAYNVITHNIPVIMLSVPLKYMHTTCETISVKDMKNLVKFIASFNWSEALKKEDCENA